MLVQDLEACISFIYANRLASDLLIAKAADLRELARSQETLDARLQMELLAFQAQEQAIQHRAAAMLQQGDLGVQCYCQVQV